jgi:hypothetical protein
MDLSLRYQQLHYDQWVEKKQLANQLQITIQPCPTNSPNCFVAEVCGLVHCFYDCHHFDGVLCRP